MSNKVSTADQFFAELHTPDGLTIKPHFPCPSCGKETLEHHPEERTLDDGVQAIIPRRICSHHACRLVFYPGAVS